MMGRRTSEAFQTDSGQSGDCFLIPEWANLSHEKKKKNLVPFSMLAPYYSKKAHMKHNRSSLEKQH